MSRISQETAQKVAEVEADRKFNHLISDADSHISEVGTEVFKKENKFPKIEPWLFDEGWVRRCTSTILHRKDKMQGYRSSNDVTIHLISFEYPSKCHQGTVSLKDTDGKVLKAVLDWENTKEEKDKFTRKVKNLILTLGTPRKIRENVPELAKYFEDKTAALMIIPTELIKEVRKGLAK